jgi:uncharacterized protein related to proFAR isomerase
MTTAQEAFAQPSESRTTVDPEGDNAAYSFDGKPDRWKRYRLPDPQTGAAQGYTRSTTFAKSISDTFTLSAWSQRKVIEGLVTNDDLYAEAASTDFGDRETMNRIAEKCKEAAGAKASARIGTALHAFSEAVDRGERPPIPPRWRPHIAAWTELLHRYNMEVIEIEKRVIHTGFDVAGTLDRLVRFTKDTTVRMKQGKRTVDYTFPAGTVACLDLKTGKTLEYGWLEIAVQLLIYTDAEVIFDQPDGPSTRWSYRPMYPAIDKNVALVIHIPATLDEAVATLYAVDLNFGREAATECEKVRNLRKRKGIAVALDVVEELPTAVNTIVVTSEREDAPKAVAGRALQVRPQTLLERVAVAVTYEQLTAIWFEAIKTRQDNAVVANAIEKRRQDLLAETAAG